MNDIASPWMWVAHSLTVSTLVIDGFLIATYYSAFLTPKSKNNKITFICFGSFYSILHFLMYQLLDRFNYVLFLVPLLATFFISAFIIFSLSLLLFKKNFNLNIFLLVSFLAVQEISFLTAHSLTALWVIPAQSVEPTQLIGLVSVYSSLFINAFISFVALKSISKVFSPKPRMLSVSELLYLILPCFLGISVSFILFSVLFIHRDYEILNLFMEVPIAPFWTALAGIILLISIVATVKLLQSLNRLHVEEKERLLLQNQVQQVQEQLRDVDGIYTEIKGMKHDMKSHLSNIRLLVQSVIEGNKPTDLEEYLGKFEDTLNRFEFTCQTGNSVSDIIIHQKYLEAVSKGIDFSVDFVYPERLNIDVYDLAIILNNGLENAIEACNNMDCHGKYIRLCAFTKGEMFFIEFENSFMGNIVINQQTGLPLSNKLDEGLHGIGLTNIQRCARKYLGDIDFKILQNGNKSMFQLTVMLQSKA